MESFLQALVDRSKQYAQLESGNMESGLSPDEAIDRIGARTRRLFELRQENGSLLRSRVYPLLDDYESITPELEDEMFDVAQRLSSYTIQVDAGLALLIYEALCRKARADGDDDRIIKYLYWRGLTMFFLHRGALGASMLDVFKEGASYADRYESFTKRETRMYINRCLGNVYIACRNQGLYDEADRSEEQTLAFWRDLIKRGVDPDFPWATYLLNLYQSRYSCTVTRYRTLADTVPPAEVAARMLDAAEQIRAIVDKGKAEGLPFGGARYDYPLLEVLFLSGQIGADEFLDKLKGMITAIAPDDYSHDATYIKLNLGSFYLNYLSKLRADDPGTPETLRAFIREVLEYSARIPVESTSNNLVNLVSIFARAGALYMDCWQYLLLVLRLTTHRHIPTLAHSQMVGLIAERLTRALAESDPDALLGLGGIESADELSQKLPELLFTARVAGLCHDMGKIDYIHTISLYARYLTETEFDIIRQHPETGKKIIAIEDFRGSEFFTRLECLSHVAGGHHRWYDGKGGYPDTFDIAASPYRALIDIVCVADSIDAATDNVGRGYAKGISLRDVCAEIQEGSGTRYSPVIARLLEDPALRADLEDMLRDKRSRAYYHAYRQRCNDGVFQSMEEAIRF